MSNLANRLTTTAATSGDRPAIRLDDQVVTYAQFVDQASRIAGWFADQGVEPGDRVGIVFPNVPAFPLHFYGALMAGAIVVPMNPLLKAREVQYYLTDSGAKHVIAMGDIAEAARAACATVGATLTEVGPTESAAGDHARADAVVERDRDDTAVILYTSGTTGRPKGAELTHWNLEHNAQLTVDALIRTTKTDVIMGCLPLFHVFGLTCGLNAAVCCGAALTLLPRFDAGRALQIIERDKVTAFEGVPTMYAGMLNHDSRDDVDLSSLQTCLSGGSPMPVEVMKNFEQQFGCTILEGWGLSESSPVASFNQPHLERRPGTIGVAVPDVQLKVVDLDGNEVPQGEVGEILIKGPNVMKGYWNKPEITAETIIDGWLRTGDMATVDEDGYYTIVDRMKDLIIRGGYNVYPREVEEALYTHPAVREAAVIGVPDDVHGEEVAAAVALKPGSTVTVEELQAHAKNELAAYKYPRVIWLVDELPKGPTGKILRREVRRLDTAG